MSLPAKQARRSLRLALATYYANRRVHEFVARNVSRQPENPCKFFMAATVCSQEVYCSRGSRPSNFVIFLRRAFVEVGPLQAVPAACGQFPSVRNFRCQPVSPQLLQKVARSNAEDDVGALPGWMSSSTDLHRFSRQRACLRSRLWRRSSGLRDCQVSSV